MNEKTDKKPSVKAPEEKGTKSHGFTGRNRNLWFFFGALGPFLLIVVLAFLYFSNYREQQEQFKEIRDQNAYLQENLTVRDSIIDTWVQTMISIEDDLVTMQEKEKFLMNASAGSETSTDLKDRVRQEIEQLNKLLKENKAKISSLNRKLRNSGIKITALQERIAKLETSLASRDSSITELRAQLATQYFTVSRLNLHIDSLNSEVAETRDRLKVHREELNKAFIATGTFKELKQKGVIAREGGLFGIGGDWKLLPNFSDDEFQKVDKSELTRIALNAKKARIISEHPADSYELVRNDSLITYLEITDPRTFWKISRYAVVETKN